MILQKGVLYIEASNMNKLPDLLKSLRLPLIGAPMFTVSGPELVIAQCNAGIVGSFPALNARGQGEYERWLEKITSSLENKPYAVNLVVHPANTRLNTDIEITAKYKVPIVITSLHHPKPVVEAVKSYGGLVFHDIISLRHAENAIEAGVDGLVLVTAGAGGHTGILNPFAFIQDVRQFYQGTIILSGSMSRGNHILAAQIMGADMAYMGTRFIASEEASADHEYKQMVVDSVAEDILCTPCFTGVPANYLKGSLIRAGLNPDHFIEFDRANPKKETDKRPWKDIWGAGQSVSGVTEIQSVEDIVSELEKEYREAKTISQ